MDHLKQKSGGSSFTENLFGPKDASSTSSGLFSSVFGPSSTGLGRDLSHSNNTGLPKKQEFGGPYAKPSTQDYKTQRIMDGKDGYPVYQNATAEPSYLSSSIYYGGQEVYSPNTHTNRPHHTFKKDGGDDDPNGSSASRGNWWQGSLYY
ncbi:hypothetical protein L1987_35190 [Smallanthus sonchifolius]|uniref:Uncharacterized protein n=1 Tax=Smallanthus sonchifolius TaxID=185202 RepID=A0ACB9HXB0_9ASTR|nr:hypothetical protein L1987_35190 [Smallanthus sonchifolius]